MNEIKLVQGILKADGLKVCIVAARFNDFIVERLIGGAVDYLVRHGIYKSDLEIVRVPGAFELPLVCKKLAKCAKYDGIVALGAVIRGATPHFEYVSAESVKGIAHVMLDCEIPIGFGLLTCDNIEQAIERAGSKSGNKGAEAANAMLETFQVIKQLS